jgi:hypothetical protein
MTAELPKSNVIVNVPDVAAARLSNWIAFMDHPEKLASLHGKG